MYSSGPIKLSLEYLIALALCYFNLFWETFFFFFEKGIFKPNLDNNFTALASNFCMVSTLTYNTVLSCTELFF